MADVDIKYNGASIATMNASGTKTCETSGKYCEGNITVEYTDPEKPTQTKSMALGAAAPATVSPDSGKVLSSVTPSIDTSVIKAANIAQGATILGVVGSLVPGLTNVRHFAYTPTVYEYKGHEVATQAQIADFRDKCSRPDFTCVAVARDTITQPSTGESISLCVHSNRVCVGNIYGIFLRYSSSGTTASGTTNGKGVYAASSYIAGSWSSFNVKTDGTGGLRLLGSLQANTTFDIYCLWGED